MLTVGRSSATTMAERAYRAIKEDIVTGVFRPGDLIKEADLAVHYHIGKTPVREALQGLQKEGLVDVIPRAGYIVSAVTTRDVQEVFQLRLILETAAAELAAKNATHEELRRLVDSADFQYTHGDRGSYKSFLTCNTEFHHMVALSSGNERLAQIVLRLLEDLERLFHFELDLRDSAEEMVEEHKALVAALVERDADKARGVMGAQIRRSRDRVLEAIVGSGVQLVS
jgi:DNA-binding GntR family transcriptional regulator